MSNKLPKVYYRAAGDVAREAYMNRSKRHGDVDTNEQRTEQDGHQERVFAYVKYLCGHIGRAAANAARQQGVRRMTFEFDDGKEISNEEDECGTELPCYDAFKRHIYSKNRKVGNAVDIDFADSNYLSGLSENEMDTLLYRLEAIEKFVRVQHTSSNNRRHEFYGGEEFLPDAESITVCW